MAQDFPSVHLDERCVYVRTPRGHRSALANAQLGACEKSLLLMVNGHTQLGILADKLPAVCDIAQTVQRLHTLGLIELVEPIVVQDTEYQTSLWPSLSA